MRLYNQVNATLVPIDTCVFFTFIQERDGIRIKCTAENFESRTRYDVKATLPQHATDGWDPLSEYDLIVE